MEMQAQLRAWAQLGAQAPFSHGEAEQAPGGSIRRSLTVQSVTATGFPLLDLVGSGTEACLAPVIQRRRLKCGSCAGDNDNAESSPSSHNLSCL